MTFNDICNKNYKDVSRSDTRYDLSLFYNVRDNVNENDFLIRKNDTFSNIDELSQNYIDNEEDIKETDEGDQNGYIEINEKFRNENILNDYEKNSYYNNLMYLNNNKNKDNTTLNNHHESFQKYNKPNDVMKTISNCKTYDDTYYYNLTCTKESLHSNNKQNSDEYNYMKEGNEIMLHQSMGNIENMNKNYTINYDQKDHQTLNYNSYPYIDYSKNQQCSYSQQTMLSLEEDNNIYNVINNNMESLKTYDDVDKSLENNYMIYNKGDQKFNTEDSTKNDENIYHLYAKNFPNQKDEHTIENISSEYFNRIRNENMSNENISNQNISNQNMENYNFNIVKENNYIKDHQNFISTNEEHCKKEESYNDCIIGKDPNNVQGKNKNSEKSYISYNDSRKCNITPQTNDYGCITVKALDINKHDIKDDELYYYRSNNNILKGLHKDDIHNNKNTPQNAEVKTTTNKNLYIRQLDSDNDENCTLHKEGEKKRINMFSYYMNNDNITNKLVKNVSINMHNRVNKTNTFNIMNKKENVSGKEYLYKYVDNNYDMSDIKNCIPKPVLYTQDKFDVPTIIEGITTRHKNGTVSECKHDTIIEYNNKWRLVKGKEFHINQNENVKSIQDSAMKFQEYLNKKNEHTKKIIMNSKFNTLTGKVDVNPFINKLNRINTKGYYDYKDVLASYPCYYGMQIKDEPKEEIKQQSQRFYKSYLKKIYNKSNENEEQKVEPLKRVINKKQNMALCGDNLLKSRIKNTIRTKVKEYLNINLFSEGL
ncbi:conserved Plasmodium protein, unknown function [Plasmodium gaboni]|uniref:Uncharacterized protein n=1 Tax=Plasmodium gaboni TaxID=647221 RepID=A0ABY1UUQ7_9APIC|nr:conserved Plasmodium protein, unknown function [Plasmodium gaboni]